MEAHREGIPVLRAMLLEFPEDPACETLDRQYLLGSSLLVAPIFSENGSVDYYLPAGRWTNLLTGEVREGAGWRREQHGFLSLPLMVRPNTILPIGAIDDRPDYDFADGVMFRIYELAEGSKLTCEVVTPAQPNPVRLNVWREGSRVTVDLASDRATRWKLQLAGIENLQVTGDVHTIADPFGIILQPQDGYRHLEFNL
jgi:alpha-D-xyloside xylohydrolase